jgi:hypothetical protein
MISLFVVFRFMCMFSNEDFIARLVVSHLRSPFPVLERENAKQIGTVEGCCGHVKTCKTWLGFVKAISVRLG